MSTEKSAGPTPDPHAVVPSPQLPCAKGLVDHEACFAPFRYCPEKGCSYFIPDPPPPASSPDPIQQAGFAGVALGHAWVRFQEAMEVFKRSLDAVEAENRSARDEERKFGLRQWLDYLASGARTTRQTACPVCRGESEWVRAFPETATLQLRCIAGHPDWVIPL